MSILKALFSCCAVCLFATAFAQTDTLKKTGAARKETITETTVSQDLSDTTVYSFAERMPEMRGGENVQAYLKQNIQYPKTANEKQGTVYISFVVEKNGSLTGVKVVKGVPGAPELEKEAVRVISQMPLWTPGTMNGKAVRVTITQPVRFVPAGTASPKNDDIHIDTVKDPRYVRMESNKPGVSDTSVFVYTEVMPELPGGINTFIAKNIRYPNAEKEEGKQGTVFISFIVEKDGSLSNISVSKEVPGAPGLTKEALRIFSVMPKWTPGMKDGKPVRVQMTQPVKFVLQ